LNIIGWGKFVKEENFSDAWWETLISDDMHIRFQSAALKIDCMAYQRKKIKMSRKSYDMFQTSLATVMVDETDINVGVVPNLMALQNLEAANAPNNQVGYKSIKAYFKSEQVKIIENQMDETASRSGHASESPNAGRAR
jgi:hypothetical protein